MSRKPFFSEGAQKQMDLIHAEISGIRLRMDQMDIERTTLRKRERDLFSALHALAKSDVAKRKASP